MKRREIGGRQLLMLRRIRIIESVVIPKYDISMKIAISLPDDVFEAADALAERLGVTRSHLYARAVAEYVAKHRDEEITQRLNAVYGEGEGGVEAGGKGARKEEGLDSGVRDSQARSVGPEEW